MFLLLIYSAGALAAAGVLWGASALLGDARHGLRADEDANFRSPAPLRGLMAPTGTAVVLPAFVTTPDGEVRSHWRWAADDDVTAREGDTRRPRAA